MKIENLYLGLKILIEHGANDYMSAGHDQLWVADAHKIKMPLSQIRELYKLGFFISEESWSLFT